MTGDASPWAPLLLQTSREGWGEAAAAGEESQWRALTAALCSHVCVCRVGDGRCVAECNGSLFMKTAVILGGRCREPPAAVELWKVDG